MWRKLDLFFFAFFCIFFSDSQGKKIILVLIFFGVKEESYKKKTNERIWGGGHGSLACVNVSFAWKIKSTARMITKIFYSGQGGQLLRETDRDERENRWLSAERPVCRIVGIEVSRMGIPVTSRYSQSPPLVGSRKATFCWPKNYWWRAINQSCTCGH